MGIFTGYRFGYILVQLDQMWIWKFECFWSNKYVFFSIQSTYFWCWFWNYWISYASLTVTTRCLSSNLLVWQTFSLLWWCVFFFCFATFFISLSFSVILHLVFFYLSTLALHFIELHSEFFLYHELHTRLHPIENDMYWEFVCACMCVGIFCICRFDPLTHS